MTVLSALQPATIRLVGQKPSAFFSATGGIEVELTDLANESARAIAEAYDWRALTTLATMVGYGGVDFDLPDDFDRMPTDVRVWSTAWPGQYYQRARDLNEWYDNLQFVSAGAPGWWIMLDGKLQVHPAPPVGTNVQLYYVSRNSVRSAGGVPKAGFTADDDVFRLDERLITLDVIWRWRAQKRLEYAEDMRNFEIALSKRIKADKGSRVLIEGRGRLPGNIGTAYPGVLGQ